MYFNKDSI